jgi:hypothetical protein
MALDLVTDCGGIRNDWTVDNGPAVGNWLSRGMAEFQQLTAPPGFFKVLNSSALPTITSGLSIEGAGYPARTVDPAIIPPPSFGNGTIFYTDGSFLRAATRDSQTWRNMQVSQIPGTSTGSEVSFLLDGTSTDPNQGSCLEDLFAAQSAVGFQFGGSGGQGADQYHADNLRADHCLVRGIIHVQGIDCLLRDMWVAGKSTYLVALQQPAGLNIQGGKISGNGTPQVGMFLAYDSHGRASDGDLHIVGPLNIEGCDTAFAAQRIVGPQTFGNVIMSGVEFGGITYGIRVLADAGAPTWLNDVMIGNCHLSVADGGHCIHLDGVSGCAVARNDCFGGPSGLAVYVGPNSHNVDVDPQTLIGTPQGSLGHIP